MNHERFCIADVRDVTRELYIVDESTSSLQSASDAEDYDSAEVARPEISFCKRVVGVIFKARVPDPLDARIFLQPARERQRVLALTVKPQGKCLQSLGQEKRIEGALTRAEVAQDFNAGPDDEGDIAEGSFLAKNFPELQPVVSRAWFREHREIAVGPVEFSGIDDHSPDRRAVSANPFRRRMNDDICSVIDRPAEISRSTERVVNDQRNAVSVSDVGDRRDVRDI